MSGHCGGNLLERQSTAAPCIEMTRHLFLTGEKGVGKSTLLQWLLTCEPRKLGGFRTVKTTEVFAGRASVHLLRVREQEQPSVENLLFFCGQGMDEITMERFNWLGCLALEESRDAELLLMDELGPHEGDALRFQAAVLDALDGEIPILGVLQKADAPFLRCIAQHPMVRVMDVTCDNRNDHAFWRTVIL